MVPFIGSTGKLGHHPTRFDAKPLLWKIFQSALVFLDVVVTGRTVLASGVTSIKPKTPCLSGVLPVATDVQSIGE